MTRSKKQKEYEKGLLPKIVGVMANIFMADDGYVKAILVNNFPELKERSVCANCGASMESYIYVLDCLDALLVYRMEKLVRSRVAGGMDFSEANKIHISSELKSTGYSVLSRQTQAGKLGLIAKVKNKNGSHNRAKGWAITERGFDFLQGKRVPQKVKVWRNKILEHFDETTTISEAFITHKNKVQQAINARKNPKYDYRSEIDTYNVSDWYGFGGTQTGKML